MEPVSGELQSHTDLLAEQVGLGQKPTVCLVPGRVPPMLWAIGGRPRLLVPSQLWATMGEDERTSLLLHELAHLKRRDHWVRWLELIVAGLYWWHPVVWWARRALREAEEQCCDAWVVWAMPRRARTYAAALLAAVEFVSGARSAPAVASATGGSGHFSCLKRRLRMIVRAKTPRCLSWVGRLGMLGMAVLLLPLAPSWAQNDESTPAVVDESKPSAGAAPGDRADQSVEDRIARDLDRDPELAIIAREIEMARKQLDQGQRRNREMIDRLKQQLEKLRAEIEDKKAQLKELIRSGKIAVLKPDFLGGKTDGDASQPALRIVTEEHLRQMISEMVRTDFELFDAQSKLEVLVADGDATSTGFDLASQEEKKLQARIQAEFQKDPEVQDLIDELTAKQDQLTKNIRDLVFRPGDLSRREAQKEVENLKRQYSSLWEKKYGEIRKQLTRTSGEDAASDKHIAELKAKVFELLKLKGKQTARLKDIQVEQRNQNDDTFEATYLNHQISSLMALEDQVKKNMEQVKFELSQDKDRAVDPLSALLRPRSAWPN